VAANNVVSLKQDQQIFDSMKKMKTASEESVLQKLLSSQRQVIVFNSALLHLHTRKVVLLTPFLSETSSLFNPHL